MAPFKSKHLSLGLLLLCFVAPFYTLAQTGDTAGVVMHEDPRLAILFMEKREKGFHSIKGSIYSKRGFRVQIYSGPDRAIAMQRKVDFIRRFPDVPSYLSYIAPTFRLKVGNFKTRAEAYEFYQQVSELYSPSMIVPDIIVINTLQNDD